ncbi:MAG: glycosyltransferase [Verrucomicrobiota bacterium]
MGTHQASLLLPSTGVYKDLGPALLDTLQSAGWSATLRPAADASILESDLVLCAGQCRNIDRLGKILSRRRGRKPHVIAWQLEPLPPASLSPEGEAVGWRASAWDWGRLPRPARKILNALVPFRTRLFRALQRSAAASYSRAVVHEPGHQGWGSYDPDIFVVAMSEWRWIKAAHEHGWIDRLYASNRPRSDFLRSRGLDAPVVPVGWHRSWGRDLGRPRDIDILFLGSAGTDARGDALRQLDSELAARARSITFAEGAYGPDRERLLNRARIVLSLLRAPHDLAGMRVLMGLACGALVVSESCPDTNAFTPGEHFVMAPRAQLADCLCHYLDNEPERARIARQGCAFVNRELTLERSLATMLQPVC